MDLLGLFFSIVSSQIIHPCLTSPQECSFIDTAETYLQLALILLPPVQGAGDAGFLNSLGQFLCFTVKCDEVESMLLK